MTKLKSGKTLLALFLGSAIISASAYAENSTADSAKSAASNAGQAFDEQSREFYGRQHHHRQGESGADRS